MRAASRTRSQIDDGQRVPARAVIIATGAEYRKLALENLAQFEGAGVYYGATPHGSAALRRRRSDRRRRRQFGRPGRGVSRAVRAARAHAGASAADWPTTHVALSDSPHRRQPCDRRCARRPRSSALEGERHLERVRWRDDRTDRSRDPTIRHVFVMTGAVPNTQWLDGLRRARREGLHQDRAGSVAGRSRPQRMAARRGRRICSRPACPASSPSATCAPATSSASHPRSAKDRSRSPSCIASLQE